MNDTGENFEVTSVLAEHIRNNLDGISKVFNEFPRPDERLAPPSISVHTSNVRIVNRIPQQLSFDLTDDDRAVQTIENGEYNVNIQLDLWTDYKEQRGVFFSRLVNLFTDHDTGMGINLVLANYHRVIAHYELIHYNYLDSPDMSNRGVWRLAFDIQAHFNKISVKTVPIITDTVLEDEIT